MIKTSTRNHYRSNTLYKVQDLLQSSTLTSEVDYPDLQATYVVPSTFALLDNCTSGTHQDVFNFSNSYAYEIVTANYLCIERVRNVTWIHDLYLPARVPVNITVLAHPGINVTHVIGYGNATLTYQQERVDHNVTYAVLFNDTGNYSLTLTAFNLLGLEAKRCYVIVIERILAMEIIKPLPTKHSYVTQIQWTVHNGSDIQCNASLGEGTFRQTTPRSVTGVELMTMNYTYPLAGEYFSNLTCFNPVSSLSNYTFVVVELPINGLIVYVIHVARDIEVNETIEVVAAITQGTNPIALIDFGDGTSNLTRTLRSFKSYPTWGFFTSNVTVYNNVSSMNYSLVIQVHKPVFPINITHITTKDTNFSNPNPFMMNISSGNDFICDWDFGDGVVKRRASNFSTLGRLVYHNYNLDKCFNGKANCSNRLYNHERVFTACVYHPITNLTFLVPSAYPSSNIDMNISFQAVLGTSVSYNITWKHLLGSQINIPATVSADTKSGSASIPQGNFPGIGIYIAELSAINQVTPKVVVTKTVNVEIPILNLCAQASHVYVQVGLPVHFYASVDAGSNVTMTWNFQDGFNQTDLYRGDTLRITGNNVSHSFAHHGIYKVLGTATNPLGSHSAVAVVYVQYPVKNLVVSTNSPQIIPLGETWFTLTVATGDHPPTNATIDVDYELNGVDRDIVFGMNNTSNFSKTITVPGIYFVNLTVSNKVSSQQLNTTFDVQREVKDFVVTPAHTDGDLGFGAPGRGPANNVFPREYPIRFNASTSDGSNVTFFVSYGDGATNVTQFYNTSHFYPTKGTFIVTVIANNSVSQMKYNTTIVLMDSNVNLTFDNDSPTMYTDWTAITILLDKIGDNACCLVDLTNNTYRIYKDKPSTVCRPDWASLTKDQHVLPSKQNISVTFSFKFWQLIYYWITTSCHNTVSYLEEYKWAIIVPLPCNFPSVEILDLGRSYSKPRRFYRSESIKPYSDASIICYASRESQFEWEINEVDGFSNRRRITDLSQNSTTNRSILVLPERSLPYGIYLLQVNVSMVGLPLVYTSRAAYAEIMPSPLQCFVYGGNGWSQSVHRDIILNGQFSFDPDEEPSNQTSGMQYFLYCKKEHSNYTFPNNPITDVTELANGGSGCINREAGLASNGLSIKTYDNGSFKVNDSLQFRLYCLKGSRLGFFDAFVKMTETDPPHCALTMDGLTLKRLVITSTKITIKAICKLWGNDPSGLRLSWTLYKQNNESKWDTLDIQQYVHSPTNRKNLVILANVLDGCASYMAKLRAQTKSGPIGYTYIILNTHCPPRWGNCSVTPTRGTPETNFTFICENWKDSQNESYLHYNYYYNVAPYNLPVLFAKTGKETTGLKHLPAGLQAFDYEVEVRIDIMDKEGAVTRQNLRVKVEPQRDDSSRSPCITLKSDIQKNGYLVQLEMEDNSRNLNAWYLQKLYLLNSESHRRLPVQKNLTSTLQEIQTFLDELPTLDPPGTAHPKTADVESIENELKSLLSKSQECCQIRERIAKSLINIQLDSLSTIQMTSASMFLLTSQPDDQCVEVQVLLVVMLQKMMSFFQVESESANFNELSKAIASFAQASAGILHGFATIIHKANSGNTTADLNHVAMAKYYSGVVLELIRNTTDTIQCCISQNEFPTRIFSPEINYTISKNTLDSLDGLLLYSGSGQVAIPEGFASTVVGGNLNDTTRVVTSKSIVFLENPFTGDNSSSNVHSYVSDFKLGNDTGSIVIGNLTKPLELWIQKKGSRTNCHQGTLRYHETHYIQFTVARNESSINIDVLDLLNLVDRPEFAVSLKRNVRPNGDDEWQSLPTVDNQGRNSNSLLFSSNRWNNSAAGDYYVAVKYNRTLANREISEENGNNALNYSLCAFTSECIYWDKGVEKWTGEGCKVGPDSNLTHTQCLCTHATSFASDFVVPPNKIDWSKISLDELFKNFLVTAILLTAIGLYFLLLIPARRQDLKDLEKIGVIPIPSNDPRDTYGYEVCLYTGFQAGMGTTAQVTIIMSGSKEQTQPRILTDTVGTRPKFYRGAVDSFLVTTPYDLGELGSIKIWHDHGGNNPSWFLSRLYIRDLQTDKKTWYICNRWLAVEEDDGKIERVLNTATNKELTSFNLLFSTEARKNFSDSHLWFSVYNRPPQSTFTRVQRMTCCLCILLSTMLANAMFYQTGEETPNAEVKIGPIRLSTKQISIAITSSLVVLPMNMLIMNLFRKSRPKNPPSENRINKFYVGENAGAKEDKDQNLEEEGAQEKDEEAMEDDDYVISMDEEKSEKTKDKQKEEKKKEKKAKKEKEPFMLPYWVIYIAYVLAFLTCAVSSLFTIFYSLTFGKEKSEGWISAMMISFWQDVLISQPIKVLAIAMILALIIKDPEKIDDGTNRSAELGHDEEWIHRDPDSNEKLRLGNFIPKPPGEDMLYEPRQRLLKQKEMKAIIKEILVYFIYIMVLCIVANGSTDPQAFHISKFTTEVFAGSSYAGSSPLDQVSEPVNYWAWLHQTVIPSLKPNYWYGPYVEEREEQLWTEESIKRTSRRGWNVKIHKRTSGGAGSGSYFDNSTVHKFPKDAIADSGTAYVIGTARLRLLKVKPGNCVIHPVLEKHVYSCSAKYSWEKEDESPYLPGWVAVNETMQEELKKDKKSPWVWRSAWDLKGTPYWGIFNTYWGGGYVANVNPNRLETIKSMQKLELEIWIDRYTRAIFTEFSLYNAYSNFFCVVTMLTEIIPTGGYYHYVQFRPIRLYRYTGPEQLTIMAFEIIYFAFLFMFTYSEIKELYRRRKKYFEDPWNYLEFLVIGMSFSAVGLYFARFAFGKFAVKSMKENPNDFISFTYLLLLEEYQVATLGFAVFFAILKSLRLLRFNRRMSLLTETVKACGKPLFSFFIMFMVIFLAYVQFAIIVFGPHDENYSSFTTCVSTMMSLTLGGFDFDALMANNRIFGPIFFFTYMIYVFMILVNVFLSIINDTLAEVKSDVDLQPNDFEIVDFVMHQIKMIAGWRVGPAITPLYKPTKTKFVQEVDAIESLAENIEYALSNTIVEDERQNNWLKPENMTRKKLVLLNAVLHIEEDYSEDDLSNLIPLMEEFLIRHTDKEVARIILGESSECGDTNISLKWEGEGNSCHDYEQLNNPAGSNKSCNYAHLYDNVGDRSTLSTKSAEEDNESDLDYEVMDANSTTQEDHGQDDLSETNSALSEADTHAQGSKEKDDSQSMGTCVSDISIESGNPRHLTAVKNTQ
ncbi:polycystin-1-like [Actinia tenebrosa]|uniref:Polycystin-1-like n=1 Tax=Actinia tenebrosa TaxID=6105 RepID=A0A6P8IPI6_ACTTE|nr:polycystin-1-like [Actinia tenebrosa]